MITGDKIPSCWILTSGYQGGESQCIGLCEALGLNYEKKIVKKPIFPINIFPASMWPFPLSRVKEGAEPPWPEILVANGRHAVASVLEIKKRSKGKTFTIYIQNPYVDPAHFDLVIVSEHDPLCEPNVLKTYTALHPLSTRMLARENTPYHTLFRSFKAPLVAVLLGGSNRNYQIAKQDFLKFAHSLCKMQELYHCHYLVTPSRRTHMGHLEILKKHLDPKISFIWDGTGENPYRAILSKANFIIASGDSISMISEATVTGKPIYIWRTEKISEKYIRFQEPLIELGIARIFDGVLETWDYPQTNEIERVGLLVKDVLRKRGFVFE